MKKKIAAAIAGIVGAVGIVGGMAGCSTQVNVIAVGGMLSVRAYGARGDGHTLDTDAINRAIADASAAGGATLRFPAGIYRCYSIHLRSNVTLYLETGAVIQAAPPAAPDSNAPTYDPPEPNPFDHYEDFGHSHFHNSLMWGENLHDVSILGPGTIDGHLGLVRGSRGSSTPGEGVHVKIVPARKHSATTHPVGWEPTYPDPEDTMRTGLGNKAIALKLCRNVTFRDFSIYGGGHFGILATGVDNFTLDNLKIDTNRDGMDIDSCQNVRISNCTVNSPFDDGICLKADFALGYNRPCNNVTITNCQVSGYVCGTLLDGTFDPFPYIAGKQTPTGRIKLGTESNGGFTNITISNCVFDHCRGLALEAVDGGPLEDIAVSNLTMRHIVNSPIFIRLGSRLRGPKDVAVVRPAERISISNVVAYDVDPKYCSIISGIPGHDIENLKLSHLIIYPRGGGTPEQAATQPAEREGKYPEPTMFGDTGAYGFFIRHVSGLEMSDVRLGTLSEDARPPFFLSDVDDASFDQIKATHPAGGPVFRLENVTGFAVHECSGLPDTPPGPPGMPPGPPQGRMPDTPPPGLSR